MSYFKYDMHVHTAEVSPCGSIPATEVVRLYKEAGYNGIVITDHYYDGYFNSLGNISWREKVEKYLEGYTIAWAEGQRIGLAVMLGIELRFTENLNDYLVYGIDEAFLNDNEELYKLGIEQFRDLASDTGLMIYQAHPFRSFITPADPAFLDGVEVYNGNLRHDSKDAKASAFAAANKLKRISGSDFHELEDLARGGIIVPEPVNTMEELIAILRKDRLAGLITTTKDSELSLQK